MPSPLELVTTSPEETAAAGEAIAELLRRGDVVSLSGDLGAGKTTFVQGACHGLGVTEPVLSPTFTLIREYEGRDLRVYHFDVYRLDRLQDVLELGIEDLFEAGGVVFIEWGDAIEGLLPESHLQVELTIRAEDDARIVTVACRGPDWAVRADGLAAILERWRIPQRTLGEGPVA